MSTESNDVVENHYWVPELCRVRSTLCKQWFLFTMTLLYIFKLDGYMQTSNAIWNINLGLFRFLMFCTAEKASWFAFQTQPEYIEKPFQFSFLIHNDSYYLLISTESIFNSAPCAVQAFHSYLYYEWFIDFIDLCYSSPFYSVAG